MRWLKGVANRVEQLYRQEKITIEPQDHDTYIQSIVIHHYANGKVYVNAMDKTGIYVKFEVEKNKAYHHNYTQLLSEFAKYIGTLNVKNL